MMNITSTTTTVVLKKSSESSDCMALLSKKRRKEHLSEYNLKGMRWGREDCHSLVEYGAEWTKLVSFTLNLHGVLLALYNLHPLPKGSDMDLRKFKIILHWTVWRDQISYCFGSSVGVN